jgi:hypothetical protein
VAVTGRREPWERLDAESQPAWESFVVYRDQGTDRSIRRVAQELDKSGAVIGGWSSQHSWVARCAAYDSELDRVWRLSHEKARRDMAIRHAQIAGAVQDKIVQRLQSIAAEDLSPADVVRWLDVSVKIERQARGEPEKVEVTGRDGGPVGVEAMTGQESRARLAALVAEAQRRLARPAGMTEE